MAFVQGFLASITLDSNDITLFTADVSLDRSKTVLNKATMNVDATGREDSPPARRSLRQNLGLSGDRTRTHNPDTRPAYQPVSGSCDVVRLGTADKTRAACNNSVCLTCL
jgi:hypothetical protein